MIEHIGSRGILLSSVDYPHWPFDGDEAALRGLPKSLLTKIRSTIRWKPTRA